jgi:tetratricopeptide (TPR) repeat protein
MHHRQHREQRQRPQAGTREEPVHDVRTLGYAMADCVAAGSNVAMKSTLALAALCLAAASMAACSPAPVKPAVSAAPPPPTPAQRLASADALIRQGCLDCLIEAFGQYDLLRTIPSAVDAGTAGAVRSAALIALRERELGMSDEGYVQRARLLLAGVPGQLAGLRLVLDVVDALPVGTMTRTPTSDLDLQRSQMLRANQAAWRTTLREAAAADEFGAYIWLAFACASETRDVSTETLLAPTEALRDAPIIAFRRAICRGLRPDPLRALVERDPRWVEAKYFLGSYDVGLMTSGQDKLDEADRLFSEAYAWRSEWPALTQSIANVAMTVEEFDRAELFYDRTLAVEPLAVDALLGKARAQTYLGKAVDAIATTDRLLAARWFVGDARYWRALNESELERNDEAWTDVELADKLLINAEVPKLAGLIAYRRRELDVSRGKFELANRRNPRDCETAYYLGIVLAEQREWPRTALVLLSACDCLQEAEIAYTEEIAKIRASNDPPERQAKKIARREQYIAKGRRYLATSWFDAAVAYYNLSKPAEARRYAEKVTGDEQFGERAKEILSRLSK